jgi:hypothetical protein
MQGLVGWDSLEIGRAIRGQIVQREWHSISQQAVPRPVQAAVPSRASELTGFCALGGDSAVERSDLEKKTRGSSCIRPRIAAV